MRVPLAAVVLVAFGSSFAAAQRPGGEVAASRPESRAASRPTTRPAAATRVYFVRHGESMGNVRGNDALPDAEKNKLTERGVAQAADVAKRLVGVEAAAIYTSPAGRARTTADALVAARAEAKSAAAPLMVEPAIGPMKEGVGADGQPFPIRARVAAWRAGEDPRPKDGESMADVRARTVAFLKGCETKHPKANVVVVAHGEVAAALTAEARGRDTLDVLMNVNFVNAGVHVFDVEAGKITYVGPVDLPEAR